MPLLVCPNDNAAMQSVSRSGVEFDFCPVCRGVWLDRGELEKLMEAGRGGPADVRTVQAPAPDPRYRPPERHNDHRRHDYDDDHRHQGRRKRGFDLFDIFD